MKYKIFWQIASLYLLLISIIGLLNTIPYLVEYTQDNPIDNEYNSVVFWSIVCVWLCTLSICAWALRNGFSKHVRFPEDPDTTTTDPYDYPLFASIIVSLMGAYLFIVHAPILLTQTLYTVSHWNEDRQHNNIGDLVLDNIDTWISLSIACLIIFKSKPIGKWLCKQAGHTSSESATNGNNAEVQDKKQDT